MSSETMLALVAALVLGAATAAVAMINYEVNASLVAFAPQNDSFRIPKESLHDSHARISDLRLRLCAIALRDSRWCRVSSGSLR